MPARNTVRLAGEHIDAQLSAGTHTLLVGPGQRDTSALRVVMEAAAAWHRDHEPGSVTLDAQTAREVKSALEDAADYRSDGGGPDACADCTIERPCRDHEVDAAMASMYLLHRDALDAALGDPGSIPDVPGMLAKLRDACERTGATFDVGVSYNSTYSLWDAEVTLYHDPDGVSGPRTGTVIEVGGSLSANHAIVSAVRAALVYTGQTFALAHAEQYGAGMIIAPGAVRNLPADVPVSVGGIGGPRIGTARVTADTDGRGVIAAMTVAPGVPGWDALAGVSMSFRLPVTPPGEDVPHDH